MSNEESFLLIKFPNNGSSEFSIGLQNVTYNQILLVASYLEMKAKSLILQEEARAAELQEQSKLIVPKTELLKR